MDWVNRYNVRPIAGMMFIWPMLRANFYGNFLIFSIDNTYAAVAYCLLFCGCCLIACGIGLHRKRMYVNVSTSNDLRNVLCASAGTLGCVLLFVTMEYPMGLLPHVMAFFAVGLWSLNFIVMIPCWADFLSKMKSKDVLFILTASFCLSLPLSIYVEMAPTPIDTVISASFPLLSVGFFNASEKMPSDPHQQEVLGIPPRQLNHSFQLFAALLIASSATVGFFYIEGTIGYPEFDVMVYYGAIFLAAALFGLVMCYLQNALRILLTARTAIVTLLAVGFMFLLITTEKSDLIAESCIVGVKCLTQYFLLITLVFALKWHAYAAYRLQIAYMLVSVLCSAISYCIVPLLYIFVGITLKGIVVFSFGVSVCVVLAFMLARNKIEAGIIEGGAANNGQRCTIRETCKTDRML